MVAMLAIGAQAISVAAPTLGGENQERNINVSGTLTITNTNATTALTNVLLSAGATDAKYRVSFSPATIASIAPGAVATVTVTAFIPLDHSGVDTNLDEKAIKIGTITASGTTGSVSETITSDLLMQAVNQLQVKKVRIECDTKSESLDDGDKVENRKPGDDCSLEIEVENNFNDNDRDNKRTGDIAFETIDFRIDVSNSDIDLDDDGEDLNDLEAGDEDSVTLSIEIDDEADDRTASLNVRVSGRDENGAVHGEQLTVRLEVVRLTHDIQIRRIELAPSRVSTCEATSVKATVNILNQGKRDEDKTAVEVSVPDLKFSKKVTDVSLDKDDSTVVTVDIPVPKNTKQGVMRVDIRSFFDAIAQSNSGSVDLTVEACDGANTSGSTGTTTSGTSGITTTTAPAPTTSTAIVPTTTTGVSATRKTTSAADSPVYLAILGVGIVLAVVVLVVLLVALLRKRKD